FVGSSEGGSGSWESQPNSAGRPGGPDGGLSVLGGPEQIKPARSPMPGLFAPATSMPALPYSQSSGLGPVLVAPSQSIICRKFVWGVAATPLALPPVQRTVMPWWVMFWVWLTVTCRVLKSSYMNPSGKLDAGVPVAKAFRSEFGLSSLPGGVIGWFFESNSPCVHSTVMAEAVVPAPVLWFEGSVGLAARAGPGR